MKSIFKTSMIAALLFGAAHISNAQVKIGTNPTAIEANSNLEVEASTAGRKVKVDKTTGKVTIADGTQANKRILTSDANGLASWEVPPVQNTDVWIYARYTGSQAIPGGIGPVALQFDVKEHDRGNNFNTSTGKITIPSAGIYQLSTGVKKNSNSSPGTSFNMVLELWVNGFLSRRLYEDSWGAVHIMPRANGTLTLQLGAGDIVDVRLRADDGGYSVGESYLTFYKLSN